jgi:hypothetical protein
MMTHIDSSSHVSGQNYNTSTGDDTPTTSSGGPVAGPSNSTIGGVDDERDGGNNGGNQRQPRDDTSGSNPLPPVPGSTSNNNQTDLPPWLKDKGTYTIVFLLNTLSEINNSMGLMQSENIKATTEVMFVLQHAELDAVKKEVAAQREGAIWDVMAAVTGAFLGMAAGFGGGALSAQNKRNLMRGLGSTLTVLGMSLSQIVTSGAKAVSLNHGPGYDEGEARIAQKSLQHQIEWMRNHLDLLKKMRDEVNQQGDQNLKTALDIIKEFSSTWQQMASKI